MIAWLLASACLQEGIAARYPGDEGIETDPRVLFVEDFETGDLKEIAARWGNCGRPENVALADDVAPGSPGRRSLRIAFGHLYTHLRPADRVHARYYIKFHAKCGYTHHLPTLLADRHPTPWPKGYAGKKPAGDDLFCTTLDAWGEWGTLPPPGKWMLYSYWHEMKPDGRGNYWGNAFKAAQEPIERDRWICVEMKLQANSKPEAADGEQAFWVDGKLVGEFKGIRWRTTEALKVNSFWLLHDSHTADLNKDAEHANRTYELWFDDLVVATEYVGPVQGTPKNGKKAALPSRSALLTGEIAPVPPGKVVFSESFDAGAGMFKGGEARDGALAVAPKGTSVWGAYATPVRESTAVRFKLKPSGDVQQVTVLIWSDKFKDNGRFYLTGLKKDEWTAVEVRGVQVRRGWAMDGPSLEGSTLNNFTVLFEGGEGAALLLDDFEVRE
jgi:hypothetical protein